LELLIAGRRQSGKSTLLKALTGYSSSTKSNKAVAEIPDDRLNWLSKYYNSKKITKAQVFISDSPNPKPNIEEESYIEKQIVPALKGKDALLYCIRGFNNPLVPGDIDITNDIDLLETYLILSDLHITQKKLIRLNDTKFKLTNYEKVEKKILEEKVLPVLEQNIPLRDKIQDNIDSIEELKVVKNVGLSSYLPLFVIINIDDSFSQEEKIESDLPIFYINAKIEAEIIELDENEQREFFTELGIVESGKDKIMKALYKELSLIAFLTAGEKDCRAWLIKKDTRAQDAAGKIHSDISRGFIKAQVVAFTKLKDSGSMQMAKKKNFVSLEGKDYIVKEGDVIDFRFNI